jgi:Lrp/AsnC family leucine-responsive transcriptional regulator
MFSLPLDEIDKKLLALLSQNSRASASDLAKSIGVTRQSVADRIERLRTEGVLRSFTLAVNPEKLGLDLRAYIAITLLPTCTEEDERKVIALLEQDPWVQECYRVTGEDYFQVRVVAPSIDVLKNLVLALRATQVIQSTRTMLALETIFEKSPIHLPDALLCPPDSLSEL